MQDRPSAAELLATVGDFVEHELMPALDGPLKYRSRVALNLCRILERESLQGEAALAAERDRLTALLGESAPAGTLAAQALALNASLAQQLRDGVGDEAFEAQAWEVLMANTRDKLAIVKPGHDSYDGREELQ